MTQPTEFDPQDGSHFPRIEDLPPNAPSVGLPDVPERRRFYPVRFALGALSWCVIITFVVSALAWPRATSEDAPETAANDSLNLVLMRAQARYLIGVRDSLPRLLGDEFDTGTGQLLAQARQLNTGPADQRFRFVVLAGELEGAAEALKTLDQVDDLAARGKLTFSARQETETALLRRLYDDYRQLQFQAPSLTAEEKLELRRSLGWFGDLSLAPAGDPGKREQVAAIAGGGAAAEIEDDCPDSSARAAVLKPAERVVITAFAALGGAVFFLFLGMLGLGVILIMLYLGKLRGGLDCGQTSGGVYAETFALWMLLFAFLGWALRDLQLGNFRLLGSGLAMLLSLAVLGWPMLRGLSWQQVRADLGLTWGRRHGAEPFIGIGCYILGTPLLFLGLAIVLILTGAQQLFGGGQGPDDTAGPVTPSHPIVGPLARGDWDIRLQIFFLASIVAPIVEEIMFRGVLYRHLRELTYGLGGFASIFLGGMISSFVFAAIHPQGILAVPVLMALAFSFVLTREWRGTLVPSMVAHGVNNTLVLLLSIAMLAD